MDVFVGEKKRRLGAVFVGGQTGGNGVDAMVILVDFVFCGDAAKRGEERVFLCRIDIGKHLAHADGDPAGGIAVHKRDIAFEASACQDFGRFLQVIHRTDIAQPKFSYHPNMKCICLLLGFASLSMAQSFLGAADADAAIQQAIREKKIPGAVLVVGHRGQVIYRKAYGNQALLPAEEPMSMETIFDIASLTKVVATTPSIMKLFEQGKVRMADKVTDYLPEFQDGQSDITIQQLMTHFSGLKPDVELVPVWSGYQTGVEKALHDKPAGPPGVKFVYSDINFILLGEIVRRCERANAGRICAGAFLWAAANAGHHVSAACRAETADCADGKAEERWRDSARRGA